MNVGLYGMFHFSPFLKMREAVLMGICGWLAYVWVFWLCISERYDMWPIWRAVVTLAMLKMLGREFSYLGCVSSVCGICNFFWRHDWSLKQQQTYKSVTTIWYFFTLKVMRLYQEVVSGVRLLVLIVFRLSYFVVLYFSYVLVENVQVFMSFVMYRIWWVDSIPILEIRKRIWLEHVIELE